MCVCTLVCVYACVCLCMCVCMSVMKHTHTRDDGCRARYPSYQNSPTSHPPRTDHVAQSTIQASMVLMVWITSVTKYMTSRNPLVTRPYSLNLVCKLAYFLCKFAYFMCKYNFHSCVIHVLSCINSCSIMY